MTLSDDLNFAEQAGEFETDAPASRVIFGIAFTPKIIGILAGVSGLVAAAAMLMYMVMPAWEIFQQQQAKGSELQGQIDQKKASIKQIEKVKQELAQSKQQQLQVLSLFANEKTLDTLLLDMNRVVESGNGVNSGNTVRAKLKKFVPAAQKAEPIIDSSLGPQVNGKLKRTSINVEIVGTYEQTQSILRNIERLQPLLLVKDYQSTLSPPEASAQSDKLFRRVGPAPITTNFQLQALMPITPEEAAANNKAAAKK